MGVAFNYFQLQPCPESTRGDQCRCFCIVADLRGWFSVVSDGGTMLASGTCLVHGDDDGDDVAAAATAAIAAAAAEGDSGNDEVPDFMKVSLSVGSEFRHS